MEDILPDAVGYRSLYYSLDGRCTRIKICACVCLSACLCVEAVLAYFMNMCFKPPGGLLYWPF